MSNPTNYTVGGIDLSGIFQPLTGQLTAITTGYKVNNTDLNQIFAPYTNFETKALPTGYTVTNNVDLSDIFAKYNPLPIVYPPFEVTGGSTVTYTNSIYVITYITNGTMNFKSNVKLPTSSVNYLFVGGGGGGGGTDDGWNNGGGGGAGGQIISSTNVFASNPTMTLTFTVAIAPLRGINTGTDGNPTTCSGTGITTITASGGLKGSNPVSLTSDGGSGGVGSMGGGSGGLGSKYNNSSHQGYSGLPGSSYVINGITYWFGGGGAGGNNGSGSPSGGLGGGGASGNGSTGNNNINPYTGPNGISQNSTSAGYNNSGGGGAGCNSGVYNSNRQGSSGLVVVWFSYP